MILNKISRIIIVMIRMTITTRRYPMTSLKVVFGQLFQYSCKTWNSSLQRTQCSLPLWSFDRLIWVLVWRSSGILPLLCNDFYFYGHQLTTNSGGESRGVKEENKKGKVVCLVPKCQVSQILKASRAQISLIAREGYCNYEGR